MRKSCVDLKFRTLSPWVMVLFLWHLPRGNRIDFACLIHLYPTFRFPGIVLFDRAKRTEKRAPRTPVFSGSPARLFWRSSRHCIPAVLPDHSLPVSVPFGSCQPGVALTGRAQGGTACFCLSPVCWPSQNAPTGTLWTRRVAATRAATANQKPWRAVVCGPQFQASGRLIRAALGGAFAPLLATQKWQGKMETECQKMQPFQPFQHGIRVGTDNLPFRGC
ncbi:hypothetical protein Selin_0907 [Desulfurispirillum indicum S5]|uniref:Uncharacterized protein n=1 Tax=Desulfurispirillum indicum (strain ATCC BAA-1389 / DSM 22839 / S5) TaxID=653733 RepID=E6W2R3_DESIS|nr:hypothetical protein Selin_0907 [Desulfurispirillum indicum S5]